MDLRDKDAILFGSAGDPHIPDHITLWGLRLKICQGFDRDRGTRDVVQPCLCANLTEKFARLVKDANVTIESCPAPNNRRSICR